MKNDLGDGFEFVPFYQLRIAWAESHGVLNLLFSQPPVRSHVDRVIRTHWRRLAPKAQEQCWESILILDAIPEEPWTGQIPTVYGLIECRQLRLINNELFDDIPTEVS